MRICRANGCAARPSSRYSIYCSGHKSRLRRHGAVDQEAITRADLEPYRAIVAARMEKNSESPLWHCLEARWQTLVSHAQQILGQTGPTTRQERKASQEVLKLAGQVEGRQIVQTTLAMFVMLDLQLDAFRSDKAFRTQLVRRVRGLADVNAGAWLDPATGRTKRAYREVSPRTSAVLAVWLAEAFGAAGLHVARLEQADVEGSCAERQAVREALSQLT